MKEIKIDISKDVEKRVLEIQEEIKRTLNERFSGKLKFKNRPWCKRKAKSTFLKLLIRLRKEETL